MDFAQRTLFRWLEMSIVRFLPMYEKRREIFLSSVISGFLFSVAASAITLGITSAIQPMNLSPIMILAGFIYLWSNSWLELNLELSRADLSPFKYGMMEFIRSALSLGLGAGLADFQQSPVA